MRNIQCKSWVFFAIKGKFQAVINAIAKRTIPFRVDTLNNKSANSRGCFSFLVIPQQKN